MKELDSVVLRRALPEHGLEEGDVGAIVHEYDRDGFEVDFVTGGGESVAVVTLTARDVRPIEPREILHVRRLARA